MAPPTLRLSPPDQAETVYALWFAWHAMYPDTALIELAPAGR
jgi:hypothetical protein